jgi:hypothetical protein
LAGCAFDGADLRDADCGGADLSCADFTDADLHGANLLGSNLEGAVFTRTRGLSSRQLMAARNWEKARLHGDLAVQLDLPPAGRNQASQGPSSPPVPEKRRAVAAGRRNRTSESSETASAFQSLECSPDPTLL